jgi:hypothetical protein
MKSLYKTTMLCAGLIVCGSVFAHAQVIDNTGDRFVPKGHSYDSSNRGLPTLNSYEDQTNNRADVYETEIYKKQRDRAFWDSWVDSTHGTYLGAEPQLTPRY